MSEKERRRFDREFKLAALARLKTATNVSEVAAALGICREMLYKWRAKHASGGAAALLPSGRPTVVPVLSAELSHPSADNALAGAERRIAALERKLGQQPLELDFFRPALRRSAQDLHTPLNHAFSVRLRAAFSPRPQ